MTVRVRYDVEPGRISGLVLNSNADANKMMVDLEHRGLSIRLDSANILTGSKQLAMDFMTAAPETPYTREGDAYVLPPLGDDEGGDIAGSVGMLLAPLRTRFYPETDRRQSGTRPWPARMAR